MSLIVQILFLLLFVCFVFVLRFCVPFTRFYYPKNLTWLKFKSEELRATHVRNDCSYLANSTSKGRVEILLVETDFCTSQQFPLAPFSAVIICSMSMLA